MQIHLESYVYKFFAVSLTIMHFLVDTESLVQLKDFLYSQALQSTYPTVILIVNPKVVPSSLLYFALYNIQINILKGLFEPLN